MSPSSNVSSELSMLQCMENGRRGRCGVNVASRVFPCFSVTCVSMLQCHVCFHVTVSRVFPCYSVTCVSMLQFMENGRCGRSGEHAASRVTRENNCEGEDVKIRTRHL
jgi:hypothetical protein